MMRIQMNERKKRSGLNAKNSSQPPRCCSDCSTSTSSSSRAFAEWSWLVCRRLCSTGRGERRGIACRQECGLQGRSGWSARNTVASQSEFLRVFYCFFWGGDVFQEENKSSSRRERLQLAVMTWTAVDSMPAMTRCRNVRQLRSNLLCYSRPRTKC